MSCCGQKRQALRTTTVRQAPPKVASPVLSEAIQLAYRGDSSMVVRGPQTGTTYLFGPRGNGLMVDGRDAPMLLRSGQFERI
jgi:hypothetical protein